MADDDVCSADTDDLDAFVDGSDAEVGRMSETHETLRLGRNGLAALPLPFFVEETENGAYSDLVDFMGENGDFVRDVSSALKLSGVRVEGSTIYEAPARVIEGELDKTDGERLDDLEAELIAQGIDPDEAAKIRAEVEAQLEEHPELSFYDAVLAGTAEYQGITVEELEQRNRAFQLYPAEVGTVVNDNFDDIAGLAGDTDKITIDDLLLAVDDESLPQEVRDAAYRLAADSILYTNMDVTNQTDLTDEPLGNGFNWDAEDGEISKDDAEQFNDKNYQAGILMAWHPLIETANQDYDLTKVDSHASEDDVVAFVSDPDIPLHVRLAVADAYADKYDLILVHRVQLEEELAFQEGQFAVGGTDVVEATGTSQGRAAPPIAPRPTAPTRPAPVRGPAGGGGGGAGAAALIVAAVILLPAAWRYGRRKRIERDGTPSFTFTNPATGLETSIDPSELEGLSPEEVKAYVAFRTTYGGPPPEPIDTIEPFPYLDATGQWRMSDTNEPVNAEPVELIKPPPPGVRLDVNGNWVYEVDGMPYDGYELSPTEREELGQPSNAAGGPPPHRTKVVTNSRGDAVERTVVESQDELLAFAEYAAQGSLDNLDEYKPGWFQGETPDGTTVKIEWETTGHPPPINEGPHVTVRHLKDPTDPKSGWVVVDKIFIEGQEFYGG